MDEPLRNSPLSTRHMCRMWRVIGKVFSVRTDDPLAVCPSVSRAFETFSWERSQRQYVFPLAKENYGLLGYVGANIL